MMKTKFLTGAAAATILLLGAAGAHANPLSIFNDAQTTQTVNSSAAASSGGGGGNGGGGGALGAAGGAGGAATQTNTSTAVSESYNSPNLAVSNNELSNTAGANNNNPTLMILVSGDNQSTGNVQWRDNGMQMAAGVFGQGSNTAQAGAAQGNASVTAVATNSFNFQ